MGKIMILDPSLLDRKRMRIVLEAAGHEVMEIAEPAEALARLRTLPRGSIKLVMSELQFPDADGLGFIKTLRSEAGLKEIPVLVVTPQPSRELVVELITIGVSTIVAKPFGGELLLRRVTETLADHHLQSQGENPVLSWTVEDYLRRELKRADRNRSCVSVIVVRVADGMGGQSVPLLMRGLVRNMRETDVLVRLGDDQIVILLPDTDAAGAAVVKRRIVETARTTVGEMAAGIALDVELRIGSATYPVDAGDGEVLIAVAAERAMVALESMESN